MPIVARAAAIQGARRGKQKGYDVFYANSFAITSELIKAIEHQEPEGCNPAHTKFAKMMKSIADSNAFQAFITAVIFLAGILVGFQTYPLDEELAEIVSLLDEMVLGIFLFEVVIKIFAEGKTPWIYFKDAWNIFDFLVVSFSFFNPGGGGRATRVLRMIRLLRVLKLVRALPKLRIIVVGLFKSFSSIVYIAILLMLILYLYSVIGNSLFKENDPIHFGSLHASLLSLFRCATMDDWTDIMYVNMVGCDKYHYNPAHCTNPQALGVISVIYFCSFIILSAMMVLNLFIGVITSSMEEAQTELSSEILLETQLKNVQSEDIMRERLVEIFEEFNSIRRGFDAIVARAKEREASKFVLSRNDPIGNYEQKKK